LRSLSIRHDTTPYGAPLMRLRDPALSPEPSAVRQLCEWPRLPRPRSYRQIRGRRTCPACPKPAARRSSPARPRASAAILPKSQVEFQQRPIPPAVRIPPTRSVHLPERCRACDNGPNCNLDRHRFSSPTGPRLPTLRRTPSAAPATPDPPPRYRQPPLSPARDATPANVGSHTPAAAPPAPRSIPGPFPPRY
jgi:hypothetical protein